MNTKGIKFLAVLAVMVMAFAAVIALAPADNDVVAENVYAYDKAQKDPAKIGEDYTGDYDKFYFSDDATVKVYDVPSTGITIYVQNGKELEIDVKDDLDGPITVYSVTGDQQRIVTSTVYTGEETGDVTGKIVIMDTEVTFVGEAGQTVIYTSMMPYFVDTHTTTTSGKKIVVDTNVYTQNSDVSPAKQMYAYISADGVLDASKIGKFVTVAPGQFIDVADDDGIDVVYGVLVTDYTAATTNTSATTEYRYYAVGADADSFDMDDNNDVVSIKNGSITVNNGQASVKATAAKEVTLTRTAADKIVVATKAKSSSGGGMSGTIVASGAVEFTSGAYVGSSGIVTIASNTTATGSIEVDGKLNLRNDAAGIEDLTVSGTNGTVVALNEKLWSYSDVKPYIAFAGTSLNDLGDFDGLVDVTAITKSADVHDSFSTAVIERNQTFIVVADTVVTTALDVKGVLVINEGVTLTITKTNKIGAAVTAVGQYAQIVNNGEILIKTTYADGRDAGLHVHGGLFENNGRIIANSDASANPSDGSHETVTLCVDFTDAPAEFSVGGPGLINNGTITVNKNDNAEFQGDKFNNKGSISVNGIFKGGEFTNGGVFAFNNAKIKGDLTLNMSKGASFNLVAAEIASGATVTVKDKTNASVAVTATDGDTNVRGIKVTDLNKKFDLSGSMGITKSGTTSGYALLTMSGKIEVNDAATIGEGYVLNLSAAKLTVPGNLTITKKTVDETDTNTGVVISSVTGLITDVENRLGLTTTGFVGAQVIVPADATYYASVEDAITAAALADVSLVTVGYIPGSGSGATAILPVYPTITEDIVIPEGMYVSGQGIVIGSLLSEPLVTIEENAGFTFQSVELYDGMIVAENVNDIGEDTVAADVKIVDDETYAATFMSLGVALALAQPGTVIELSQNLENTSRDLVIPEGVTVDATAADEHFGVFIIDSNLVVDGLLVVDDFRFIATTDDTKSITVNGTIMAYNADGKGITKSWYTPVGVSYKLTIPDETGDEHTWYVLTNLSRLQESIDAADDAKVTVEGDVKLGDITINGRDDMPAEVTFNGDVDAGTITIDDTTLIFKDGNKVTATVADALGSITIKGAYVKDKLSIYSMDQSGVFMAGQVIDATDGTYSIRFDGITGMNGSTKTAITWGKYTELVGGELETVATPTILFAGETTATGKKVTIGNTVADDEPVEGMVTVAGELIADNGNKLIINSDVEVLGGLYAAERTEEAVPGTVEIAGDLFVGALKDEVYSADDALDAYKMFTSNEPVPGAEYGDQLAIDVDAAAIVSGKVSVAEDKFITVLAGSVVDPAIVEDLDYLDVIIEDTLWLTVYGLGSYSMDGLKAPIVNADVDSILDAYGNSVADFSFIHKVIYNSPAKKLADYGSVVGISLDYYVFNVTIKTDGSVKAVYIDGILMYTGENRNTFTLDKVATGTHKVTVEAATGYDADKCVLYTEMGTILPGMAFTFTEYDCEFDAELGGYVVIYNINGTEIQPEPVPPTPEEESQWTVTTILLVILVVLIAIMAVIVALRLNRS